MYENAVAGIVTIIGVAIVLGVGTTVLGSQNTAFDCTTVLGYQAGSITREGSGTSKTNTKTTGIVDVTFSHGPINAGDTASVTYNITDPDSGDLMELFTILHVTDPDGETVIVTQITGSTVTGEGTFNEPGRYAVEIRVVYSGGVGSGSVSFNIQVGQYTVTSIPDSYTSWAKICQDVNEQNRQAWLLVPVILIVIAAGVILFFLRHGFS